MIIVLSNSQDATADYLCSRLHSEKFNYIRLDTDNLIETVKLSYVSNEISLIVNGQKFKPKEIRSVWYRRPEPLKSNNNKDVDEGEKKHTLNEWSAMLDGYLSHIDTKLWINHPMNNALASSKLYQLGIAEELGLIIPKTLVTQEYSQLLDFYNECQNNLIIKPISHGYIERKDPKKDTLIYTNEVTVEQINNNKELLSLCPTLFQEKIDKTCDVRVNVIDREIVAVAIYSSQNNLLQSTDIRRNNMLDVKYEVISLPSSIKTKLLKICEFYKLRFAAIDMAIDKNNRWFFFEINPNGQWAWLDLVGVTDMANLFIKSMI